MQQLVIIVMNNLQDRRLFKWLLFTFPAIHLQKLITRYNYTQLSHIIFKMLCFTIHSNVAIWWNGNNTRSFPNNECECSWIIHLHRFRFEILDLLPLRVCVCVCVLNRIVFHLDAILVLFFTAIQPMVLLGINSIIV